MQKNIERIVSWLIIHILVLNDDLTCRLASSIIFSNCSITFNTHDETRLQLLLTYHPVYQFHWAKTRRTLYVYIQPVIIYNWMLLPQYLTALMNQVRDSGEHTSLLPHKGYLTPPGGQLIHKLSGHTDAVVDLALTKDGEVAVTGRTYGDIISHFVIPQIPPMPI